MTDIEKLQKFIDESNNIVFFGGAGVSTESGIPDFRSKDGLYSEKYGDDAPETILSARFFKQHPSKFWEFYVDKILMNGKEVLPNSAHKKLAELEKCGKLKAIVTQNIDTLHQDAGSKNVYQIHGTTETLSCCRCHKPFVFTRVDDKKRSLYLVGDTDKSYTMLGSDFDNMYQVPVDSNFKGICPACTGVLKPDIVLYDENLPYNVWDSSIKAIKEADCLIVAGTSLSVYPAASLLDYYHGDKLVIINRDETQADSVADLVIHDSIGKVLSQIKC